jgi:hypothetical protein
VVAAGAVLMAAAWVRPVLALPAAFTTLLRGAVVVGLPFALALAWHYPKLGHHGIHPDHEGPPGGGLEHPSGEVPE